MPLDLGRFYLALLLSLLLALPTQAKDWQPPIKGVLMNPFGYSYRFYGYYRSGHTGVDLAAPIGTPVHAVSDGVVRKVVSTPNMRYGNYIMIAHSGQPYFTLYGHLSHIYVNKGEIVKAGDFIGASGISGLASYPHLHFEVLDRVPEHDGAWGYRYICRTDTQAIKLLNLTQWGPVKGLTWLDKSIGHLGGTEMVLKSYFREHDGVCSGTPDYTGYLLQPRAVFACLPSC